MQHEITQPSLLLDKHGELLQKGYAILPILKYRRSDVKDRHLKLKEFVFLLLLIAARMLTLLCITQKI